LFFLFFFQFFFFLCSFLLRERGASFRALPSSLLSGFVGVGVRGASSNARAEWTRRSTESSEQLRAAVLGRRRRGSGSARASTASIIWISFLSFLIPFRLKSMLTDTFFFQSSTIRSGPPLSPSSTHTTPAHTSGGNSPPSQTPTQAAAAPRPPAASPPIDTSAPCSRARASLVGLTHL
jgi:cell division septation protein DedD